ncbi:hypothetical protein [Streptomyces sp. NPDC055992]|uniref:hypothetical protein n=1 Tax=Streptomyces sp. NPDC055992 TaxID=3345673 RepID=UPI0035E05706
MAAPVVLVTSRHAAAVTYEGDSVTTTQHVPALPIRVCVALVEGDLAAGGEIRLGCTAPPVTDRTYAWR